MAINYLKVLTDVTTTPKIPTRASWTLSVKFLVLSTVFAVNEPTAQQINHQAWRFAPSGLEQHCFSFKVVCLAAWLLEAPRERDSRLFQKPPPAYIEAALFYSSIQTSLTE